MSDEVDQPRKKTPLAHRIHGPTTAWIVLACGLIVTVAAWLVSSNLVEDNARDRFDNRVDEISDAIKARMDVYVEVLRGGVAFFESSNEVTRAEFENYVSHLDLERNWPGIQGIGYSIPLKPEELETHIASVRAEGFPDYHVFPEDAREAYTTITYIEPFDWRNKRAFGYDMWSEPVRREAMKRARDEGVAATSGIITLVQETEEDTQLGFLTYVPLYKLNAPLNSVDERRAAFVGWVYAPFRMGDFMEGILGGETTAVEYEIFDGSELSSKTLLFDSNDQPLQSLEEGKDLFHKIDVLNLQGREWYVNYREGEDAIAASESRIPLIIGAVGLVIDFLLFYVITSLAFINKRTAALVEEKTKDIEVARQRAEAANKAKSAFLSSMSHEFRTPLNAILGFGQILEAERLTKDQKESVNYILSSGELLLNLVNDVLDLSSIEAGKLNVSSEPCDLHTKVNKALSVAAPLAEKYQIEVVSHVDDDGITVLADPLRFQQVLINVLSNGIKYNRRGGKVVIRVREGSSSMVQLEISDTGVGIPEDFQKSVFQPFNRLAATNSTVEGTGIGLTICRQLLEMMGGSIELEKSDESGTTFLIEIPRSEDKAANRPSSLTSRMLADTRTRAAEKQAKLLYVEDNAVNVMVLRRILSDLDHIVVESVVTAEEALELVPSMKPKLILMDINLPGMNGIEATKKLKTLPEAGDIPVIAVSAAALPEDMERAKGAGFFRYVVKPFRIDELLDAVQSALASRVS